MVISTAVVADSAVVVGFSGEIDWSSAALVISIVVRNISENTVDISAVVVGNSTVDDSADCAVNAAVVDEVSVIAVETSNVVDVIVVSVSDVLNGFSVVIADVSATSDAVVLSCGEAVKLYKATEEVANNSLVSSIAIAGV